MKKFQTKYVAMNPSRCVACWKCVETCPKNVVVKVGFLWHKHAAFSDVDACIGCKKCVKTCPQDVFFVPNANFKVRLRAPFSRHGIAKTSFALLVWLNENVPSFWQRIRSKLRVESVLFLFLLASVATGVGLHVAGHDMGKASWHTWLIAHIVSALVTMVLSLIHVFIRRRK